MQAKTTNRKAFGKLAKTANKILMVYHFLSIKTDLKDQ